MEDEGLFGLTLRLDAASGFPCWTVARDAMPARSGVRVVTAAMWLAGTVWDLDYLARRSRIARERLRELTVWPELERLFPSGAPTVRALGTGMAVRVCPICWAERRLVRRTFFLPLIVGCPEHLVRLATACDCGEGLTRSDGPSGTPHCGRCGKTWASLTLHPLDPGTAGTLTDLSVGWATLLGLPGVNARASTLRVARARQQRAFFDPSVPLETRQFANISLRRLVTLFVALGIDDRLVGELLAEDAPRNGCPNATCPFYPPRVDAEARPRESHCHHCGARFIGTRIISCFDVDHGSADGHPRPSTVRVAQERLGGWKDDLRRMCARMLESDETITVASAFRAARVPPRANLRATRLGLVDIVSEAIHEQRMRRTLLPAAFASLTTADYRVLAASVRALKSMTESDRPGPVRAGLGIAASLLDGSPSTAAPRRTRGRRPANSRPATSPHRTWLASRRNDFLTKTVASGRSLFPTDQAAVRILASTRLSVFPVCPYCGRPARPSPLLLGRAQRICLGCLRLWAPLSGTRVARIRRRGLLLEVALALTSSSTSLQVREVMETWATGERTAGNTLRLLRDVMGVELDVLERADRESGADSRDDRAAGSRLRQASRLPGSQRQNLVPASGYMEADEERLLADFSAWSRKAFGAAPLRRSYVDEWLFRRRYPDPHKSFERLLIGLVRPSNSTGGPP